MLEDTMTEDLSESATTVLGGQERLKEKKDLIALRLGRKAVA